MPQRELPWGHSTVDTACPLDCPDSCSLSVTVARGKIVKIEGSTRHGVTDGYICAKVRRFDEHVYGPSRLLHPAVRVGSKGQSQFKRVSWDEALELVARRLDDVRVRLGGEAILPFCYGGSNGLLSQDTTDAELFRCLGASRLARTVCAAPTGAAARALYGTMPGVTYADYQNAALIVLWGTNPTASGIHQIPHIREARRNGARLVVIDPRRTSLAKQADVHLSIRPGTDVAVALALHRYLFENDLADLRFLDEHTRDAERLRERAAAWTIERAARVAEVDADDLLAFADLYAQASPAVIRCGWGLERNRNGGHAALAILALPAVGGKFGVRGGGYSMNNADAWGLSASSWIDAAEPATRVVNMNHLGRALLDYDNPPVAALFVYNCNPLATMPDQNRVAQGLQREDLFTVVFEQVMTDTARYADVLLPATTFLETYDVVKAYGPIHLELARPVIDVVGEARPNVEVFSQLADRLGLAPRDGVESDAEALMRVAAAMPEAIGRSLLESGHADPPAGGAPVQFVDVFPRTPDRKVHLFPESLEATAGGLYAFQADPATAACPLVLISPASYKTISSTLGELRERPASLAMHPADAGERGIEKEDMVRVFNERGEVHCRVRITADIRPGTVSLPKGLWQRSTFNGSTANALVPDSVTDIGGGACFNDARVQVTRVIPASLGSTSISLSIQ